MAQGKATTARTTARKRYNERIQMGNLRHNLLIDDGYKLFVGDADR